MPTIFPLKLSDSFGIPLRLEDKVELIHEGREIFGIIHNYYYLEEEIMISIRNMDNPDIKIYYPVSEIVLIKFQIAAQNFKYN